MSCGSFTLSGGYNDWRIWLGSELVASFPTLNQAWDALKAAREAVQQLERI